jgi:hypothetical protein
VEKEVIFETSSSQSKFFCAFEKRQAARSIARIWIDRMMEHNMLLYYGTHHIIRCCFLLARQCSGNIPTYEIGLVVRSMNKCPSEAELKEIVKQVSAEIWVGTI